jgi:fructokinase
MAIRRTIVGLGEALYDVFPDMERLGGAPLNMTVQAGQLGNTAVLVSRIGQDQLGDRMAMELRGRQIDINHLQTDPDHPTGTVLVDFDDSNEPQFRILENVAWDYLQFDPDLDDLAGHCDAVCFGSLAQRGGQTRNTIYRFLTMAQRAVRLFDVNVRQHYYDRRIMQRSLELASAVKLNESELLMLGDMYGLGEDPPQAARKLIDQFKLKWLALTRGPRGTVVFTIENVYEADPVSAEGAGDAVGAGDATAAALLHGTIRRWDWPRTLNLANRLGAFVASQQGACPTLPEHIQELAR